MTRVPDTGSARPVVVLLRASDPSDPYEAVLEAAGFDVRSRPVLAFSPVAPERLAAALARPEAYAGLVVTSPRAVAAIRGCYPDPGRLPAGWREKPVYAVGPRTAAAVRALGWTPVGEEAGSGAALASIIITAAEHGAEGAARPYLFLCGDRRRDDVPHRLTAAGLAVEECVVYRTHVRAGVKLPPASPGGWLVFFSPSGVETVHPGEVRASGWRVAAIGPTTARALAEAGIPASAVAAEPTPEALRDALQAA